MKTIDVIAGARPNFVKVAALFAVAADFPTLRLQLIHTGQHRHPAMSDVFFDQLALPEPTHHLYVEGVSQAEQTAAIMIGYEQWVRAQRPDLTLVVGDVNSTLACALVAAKAGIPLAHIEAGLRSFDRVMPEEINRIVTDSLSDLFFVSELAGVTNLMREGQSPSAIHLVGQTIIDTLLRMRPRAEEMAVYQTYGLPAHDYVYLTLHRPSNVDSDGALTDILQQIEWLAARIPVIFPVHPRTRARLIATGHDHRLAALPTLRLIEPVGYLESLSLLLHARMVITDSGGLQEESTALGIPCLTLRANTERPITLEMGTNTLINHDWQAFRTHVARTLSISTTHAVNPIPLWDGKAAQRILQVLMQT